MRLILLRAGMVLLGFALAGCGAANSSKSDAVSEAKPTQAAAELAAKTVPVTTATIGPGKYLASVQGMS